MQRGKIEEKMEFSLMPNRDVIRPDQFSVGVHFLRLLMDYVSRSGLSADDLLAQAEIDAKGLSDPNGRVSYARFHQLCEMAAQSLQEPCFGLKLGQSIQAGYLGSYGFALMSCSTATELMQQSARYSALAMDAGHNVFEQRGQEFVRIWHSNLPGTTSLGRLQDELQQAIGVSLARSLVNRPDLNPNWVSFQYAQPDDVSVYEALFQCPLRFNAPETAMAIDAALLTLPLPHANAQVCRIMDDLCTQLLKQLGSSLEPPWLAIARKTVLESFKQGCPGIGRVAQAAGMTEGQFKERLSERGLSFRSFIDELRRALAVGYMRDPDLGLVDVAYLLGFSEQSAFQRAFKRWTGMSPGDYRRTEL